MLYLRIPPLALAAAFGLVACLPPGGKSGGSAGTSGGGQPGGAGGPTTTTPTPSPTPTPPNPTPSPGSPPPRDGATPGLTPAPAADGSATPPADAGLGVGPTAPAPPPFKAPGVVAYWGQNGYSRRSTDPTRYEKELATVCAENPHYEAMVVAFIISFISPENADGLPRTNFSVHCTSKNAFDAAHPRLYKCDEIGRGINECQRMGKKVFLSLGGAVGGYGFTSDEQARQFAQTLWDLFLGGQSTYRPFSTAVMDGVDLDIEGGSTTGYTAFVRRMREIMNGDKSRRYYITGAPQCIFPDAFLGPGAGKPLGDVPNLFDYLFVQFYNNPCGGFNPDFMVQTYNQWAKVGPKILVGLPAAPDAGGGFVARSAVPGLLGRVKGSAAFSGVMIWDASYDQNSVENGVTYGAFMKGLLK
jgi:chitinase